MPQKNTVKLENKNPYLLEESVALDGVPFQE